MNEQEQATKKKRTLVPKALTPAERRAMERYLIESGLQTPFPFAADLLPPSKPVKRRKKEQTAGVHHD